MNVLLASILVVIIGSISTVFGGNYLDFYFKNNGLNNPLLHHKFFIAFLFASLGSIFIAWAYGDYGSVFASVFLGIAILVSITDITIYKIPNLLSYMAGITSLISLVVFSYKFYTLSFLYNFFFTLLGLCLLILFLFLFKIKIGMGDIKLYFAYFLWIGAFNYIFALYAYILSLLLLVFYFLIFVREKENKLPMAPFICGSTLLIWLFFISSSYTLTEIVIQ